MTPLGVLGMTTLMRFLGSARFMLAICWHPTDGDLLTERQNLLALLLLSLGSRQDGTSGSVG
jgi:hypothetical protein